MSESLKHIKNRIRSIESIKKITRAMEMVSLAKLRPCQNSLEASRRYLEKIDYLLSCSLAGRAPADNPFLRPPAQRQRITLCVISSDTGLCGTYNNNLFRKSEEFIRENSSAKISLAVIGRKGFNYFKRRGYGLPWVYLEPRGNYTSVMLDKIVGDLTRVFLSPEADEVYLAYTRFESASRQRPVIEKFLNIDYKPEGPSDYIIEPDSRTISDELVKAYISHKMQTALWDAKASEHAGRVISMAKATDNAKELLDDLILLRNKVRQAGITKEILEIIASAEALKG